MRYTNLNTWPRCKHFDVFHAFDYPHFNVCGNVDVTTFYQAVKTTRVSLTIATTYMLTHVANNITEFRYHIRDDQVVGHEVVHPSITLLAKDDLSSYCAFTYTEDFYTFVEHANARVTWINENPTLEDEPAQDNLLFMSSMPWVSFTGDNAPASYASGGIKSTIGVGQAVRGAESLEDAAPGTGTPRFNGWATRGALFRADAVSVR
ncbi:MAG: chloramphenicol acetyltransferase [Chloroflexi bacterium AL-W]|nr:chloramphenicol acetyltransferase [Chloroflexi bacterium AL-N1]NOK66548.1 chloramphenicol acetyltransferase [Chloroflexi bacterium AL-N10]NOK71936.1 chloramphenicol acetyltransferase [Chloroflexi bacterium AL-N5]NOK81193.1 chloramphenicol acetyltransferase [Chloroflexi bacterium AL-W]NOK89466.1 chloramphenicol acetyltransferase [Chloroflexi bacterium AL-N15]